jgi:hypothetical protein
MPTPDPQKSHKALLKMLRREAPVNQVRDGQKSTTEVLFGVHRTQREVEERLFGDFGSVMLQLIITRRIPNLAVCGVPAR